MGVDQEMEERRALRFVIAIINSRVYLSTHVKYLLRSVISIRAKRHEDSMEGPYYRLTKGCGGARAFLRGVAVVVNFNVVGESSSLLLFI